MLSRIALIGVFVGGAAWAAEPAAPQAEGAAMDPQAEAQLRKMSDYLAGMKTFRVDATTVDEKVTTDGQKIQEMRESKLTVKRPNGLMIVRRGPMGNVVFRYDGKQFSVLLRDKNQYGQAPAPATLDEAVDDVRDRFHMDAPGGDLVVSNSYADLTEGVVTARYIGLEPIGKVMAHHLAVTKKDVDYQIWIQDGAQPLPLRYVITTKDLPGKPQFTLELRNWEPNVQVPANSFAFTPPPNAQRIELGPPPKAQR